MAGLTPDIRRKTTEYATVPLKNTRRFRRMIWASAVSVCLATAAVGWAAWDHAHIHDATVPGDVLMSNHGQRLTTPIVWTDCEDKPHLEAHESAHAITLVLKRKRHDFQHDGDPCDGMHDGLASTSLDSPVGDRKITDLITGSGITPFDDAHFPYPRYLPSGFTPAHKVIVLGNRAGPPYSRVANPTWTSAYQRNRDKGGQAGAVSITAITGETTTTKGTPISVNGHPARLQETPGPNPTWTAVWPQNGYTITVYSGDPLMTDAEFLRITKSLRN
ncbi:hypothetical protein ACH41H_48650 [Streptomyces sp. NPDC020800]|uniref:hypothetical protein n=1 Tax=Streptomyces sp. NPDC020800 TaxID=3365092 RepID=UPI0037B0B199